MVTPMFESDVLGTVYGFNGMSNVEHRFLLSEYEADEKQTAYSKFREALIQKYESLVQPFRIELALCFVSIGNKQIQKICTIQGDVEWIKKVEYFTKYVGSMGGTGVLEANSFGFIDNMTGIRIEFENGTINILRL